MRLNLTAVEAFCDKLAPQGTPRRKLILVLSIVLFFEGISVLILFSYDAAIIGIVSMVGGAVLVFLFPPSIPRGKGIEHEAAGAPEQKPTLGIQLLDFLEKNLGGPNAFLVAGVAIVALVILYNRLLSHRPELGDLDTLSILFGGMVAVYPLVKSKIRVEAAFSLMFLGLVVIFLVVPQAVMSLSSETGSSVGNAYVHYMLAAPFAGILNLLGIHAHVAGNTVFLTFIDGTPSSLTISAYCAGMYSFSIFVAAFFSFVLVFERLPPKTMTIILALGLLIAYLGNVFRMVIIGVVGYYRGMEDLLWTHRNVGWVIFLSWSAVFWYLVLGYVSKRHPGQTEAKAKADEGENEL